MTAPIASSSIAALPLIPHRAGGPPPRRAAWDSSLAFWSDPYRFIQRTSQALDSDVFRTRLLLQPTLCLTGPDAARLFYDEQRFQRAGAAPEPLRPTLFGQGTVQSLDGGAHRIRKAWFLAQTGGPQISDLLALTERGWHAAMPAWQAAGRLSLYRAVQPLLTRAICDWAGVPLPEDDVQRRCAQLSALFDGAARGPWAHLRSRLARWRAEAWLSALVREARAADGERAAPLPSGTALASVAQLRDADGALLPPRVAAAELLNLLRPVVAVSVYIAFVAHALQAFPDVRASVSRAGPASPLAAGFVQEVRRFYPFFPAVAARVRQDFVWRGLHFAAGQRALFDLYGTNHDPRAWNEPQHFMPERWIGAARAEWRFVPQGGGDPATQHRCPGEDLAVRLMLQALHMLLHEMQWQPANADLRIAMGRLPALPAGGVLIENVRLRP